MQFDAGRIAALKAELAHEVTPIRAFDAAEYASRLRRLHAAMAEDGIDVLILSSPEAMCWLHGYQARWYNTGATTQWPAMACTAVHVDHDRFVLFEVGSHATLIERTSIATDVRFLGDDPDLVAGHAFVCDELRAEGWLRGRTALEKWSPKPSPAISEHLEAMLRREVDVVDATRLVRGVQRLKSAAEIEVIREAARICDVGLARLTEVLHPETTELEAWGEMMLAMAREGGEPAALHEVVCAGLLFAGHSISAAQPVGSGLVYADPCGVKHRYHANICRTFHLGEPSETMLDVARIAGGAYDVLADVARPGTSFATVGARLREYYRDAGVWDVRGWVGGYQLGIAFPPDWVGEQTFSVELDEHEKVVEHGLVMNYESVVGIGMIDTILYLDEGTEALSTLPRELIVIR